MKVLFLTYDGLTDQLGQSQVLPYLLGLSKLGHQISILSLEKKEALASSYQELNQICLEGGLDWHYLPYPEDHNLISQFRTSVEFKKKAYSLALQNKVNLLHCRSYPAAMAGRFVQKRTAIPWIFDIRGFWIDERIEGNIWNFKNPIILILVTWLRYVEKLLYKQSAAIVSLTHNAEKIIREKFLKPQRNKTISVIACRADYSVFKPQDLDKQSLRQQLDLPLSAFILVYLGSLGTWYMLKEMLEFFSVLLSNKPGACFLFVSKENPDKILKISRLLGIPDQKILVYPASREKVPLYLSAADCGISFIKPSFSKKASSPVKWAESLACGLPLIVNNNIGDIAELEKSLKGVMLIEGFNPVAYQKTVNLLSFLPSVTPQEISESSRKVYNLADGIRLYNELYQKVGRKKILFIAAHRPGRAPNQRFRFEQYFPYFEKKGFQCELSYLIEKKDDDYLYKPGNILKKAWFFSGKCYIRRFKNLKNLKQYDIIFIAREALMTRSAFFEKRYSKSKAKMIFDFDDSIWLTNVSSANRWFHWMKNPGKTARIIAMSDHVIAGNQYLADYASHWTNKLTIIPTVVDSDIFSPLVDKGKKENTVTIGWTGSITTIPHFEFIIPVLIRIKNKYGARVEFEVIGDEAFFNSDLDLKGKAWSLKEEKTITSSFDIGIMPLPDNQWTRGKCGFKGLLCMSLGVPVIMSRVGVNSEIIRDGENGFLATSEDEWFEKLCKLIDNQDLRLSFSEKGRQTLVENYSVQVWKDTYIDIFNNLLTNDTEE